MTPAKRTRTSKAKSATRKRIIRCGVIGYGPKFGMGRNHVRWMAETPGLKPVAVCDIDPSRLTDAENDSPGIETYASTATMLRKSNLDLVTIVTPHNSHAPLAIQCAKAGKHLVVEKPMCITVAQADRMIETAKDNGVMLSVFHNRRWDGDFMTLRDIIARGTIGEVFHIETFWGGYQHPGIWWRSEKRISGGAFHDWGAHYVDWVLNLVPAQMESISGYYHKLVWHDVSIEDQVRAVIRFDNSAVADLQLSYIAAVGKDRWRILGTKGGIRDGRRANHFLLSTYVRGKCVESEVPYLSTSSGRVGGYYRNIADHLLRGKKLAVTPEQARRVITVFETAEKSAKAGKALKPKYT